MLVPVSWLKDFVDIDVPVELLAERLTVAGLEVAHLKYIGLPQQSVPGVRMPRSDHLVWDREKLLLARIVEVRAHPNADRLVLAMVDYGGAELEQCVTGATNLFPLQGSGTHRSANLERLRDARGRSLGRAQRQAKANDAQGQRAARHL